MTYLGQAATRRQVEAAGPGSRFIHFATHAFVSEREPLLSELLLAPALPEHPTDAEQEPPDHRLRAVDLFGLRLDAQVVVCAGCSTALGKSVEGEGVVGLTQALFYAAARCVVLSLWPVHDQPTARLMKRFYEALRSGQPPADALRTAKLSVRQDDPAIYGDPYDWAAFVAIGAGW